LPVINKFYLLCVIFSGSPDLTLKTGLVIGCLKIFDVPDKLIILTALTLIQTRARVKINRYFTEEFIVECGVKK